MRGSSGGGHALFAVPVVREIERVASGHLGRPWTAAGFTDLDDRASHPCGVLHGRRFSVFAKLQTGADAARRCAVELRDLDLLRRAGVATPAPVGTGTVTLPAGCVLLLEAVPETPPQQRSAADWRAIGHALAHLHRIHGERFGADADNYFGPLAQDNRPAGGRARPGPAGGGGNAPRVPRGAHPSRGPGDRWADFYAARRLEPLLRYAVDAGHLPEALTRGVERIVARLPDLCGADPRPSLLHGDAQQNNILTGPGGPVLLDPAPYFGHPEVDLAFVDLFGPVPDGVFDGYREAAPIDPGFADRRELWRLSGYLAVLAVDGGSPFGRSFVPRVAEAIARYG